MEGGSSEPLANPPCPEPEVEVAGASGTNEEPDGGDEDNEDTGDSNEEEKKIYWTILLMAQPIQKGHSFLR